MLLLMLGLLETGHVLELRATKGAGRSRLEGAAEEQLRGKEGRELHVEGRSRGGQVIAAARHCLGLVHGLSVKRWHVATARVTISKSGDVGSEGAMRKASIAVGRLRRMAKPTAVTAIGASLANGTVEILHPEKMRGDLRVPPGLR